MVAESVPSETPRPQGVLPLHPDYIKGGVESVINHPDFYNTEWTTMSRELHQRPLAKYISGMVTRGGMTFTAPFSSNENREAQNNYIKGALTMYRMLRFQALNTGTLLPDITMDVLKEYTDTKRAASSGVNRQERFASMQENARRNLAGENIDIVTELNKLTEGVPNADVTYGAADVYGVIKLAIAKGNTNLSYKGYYSSDPLSITNEDLLRLKAEYNPEYPENGGNDTYRQGEVVLATTLPDGIYSDETPTENFGTLPRPWRRFMSKFTIPSRHRYGDPADREADEFITSIRSDLALGEESAVSETNAFGDNVIALNTNGPVYQHKGKEFRGYYGTMNPFLGFVTVDGSDDVYAISMDDPQDVHGKHRRRELVMTRINDETNELDPESRIVLNREEDIEPVIFQTRGEPVQLRARIGADDRLQLTTQGATRIHVLAHEGTVAHQASTQAT